MNAVGAQGRSQQNQAPTEQHANDFSKCEQIAGMNSCPLKSIENTHHLVNHDFYFTLCIEYLWHLFMEKDQKADFFDGRDFQNLAIPYLRSLTLLTNWNGQGEQDIPHLCEAAVLAVEIGLPEELW